MGFGDSMVGLVVGPVTCANVGGGKTGLVPLGAIVWGATVGRDVVGVGVIGLRVGDTVAPSVVSLKVKDASAGSRNPAIVLCTKM